MMTALRGYGGLTFSTACEVLLGITVKIYPEWVILAKVACIKPVSSVPAERGFSLQIRIKTAQQSRFGEGRGLHASRAAERHLFTIILIQVRT